MYKKKLLQVDNILEWEDRISYHKWIIPLKNTETAPMSIKKLEIKPLVLKNDMEHFVVKEGPLYAVLIGERKVAVTGDFKNYVINANTIVDAWTVKELHDEYVKNLEKWFTITRAGAAKTTKDKVIIANETGVYEYTRSGEDWDDLYTLKTNDFEQVYAPEKKIIDALPGHDKSVLLTDDLTIIYYDHATGKVLEKPVPPIDYAVFDGKIYLPNGTIKGEEIDDFTKVIFAWSRLLPPDLAFKVRKNDEIDGAIIFTADEPTVTHRGRKYYHDYFRNVYVTPGKNLCFTPKNKTPKMYKSKYYCPVLGQPWPPRVKEKIDKEEGILPEDVLPGLATNYRIFVDKIRTGIKKFEVRPEYIPEKNKISVIIPYLEGLYRLEVPEDNEIDVYSEPSIKNVPEEYVAEELIYTGGFKDVRKIEYYEFLFSIVYVVHGGGATIFMRVNRQTHEKENVSIMYRGKDVSYGKEVFEIAQLADSIEELLMTLLL